MRQVEGRVYFAGEHTSLWIAWMNGALESAERVVAEILHADGERRRTAGLVTKPERHRSRVSSDAGWVQQGRIRPSGGGSSGSMR